MILVYCDHITPRHRFIFRFIFEDVLGLGLHITEDRNEFFSCQEPKINYSHSEIEGSIQFRPHSILSEPGINPQDELLRQLNNLTIEQLNLQPIEHLPFDPFALSFYLVTRYEEYLPFNNDIHGRFPPEQSLAFKKNFLRIPLVDLLADKLKQKLEEHYPGLKIPGQPFRFIPSFDIDIAFAHLGKGWLRASGAWMKILLKGNLKQARERIHTMAGKMNDPYDNFGLHLNLAEKYKLPLLYFVLLGDFSEFDRNVSYKNNRFRNLIKELNINAEMGLHPSYRSHLNPELFEKEKKRLEGIIEVPVSKGRFHFLRLNFPASYRLLLSGNIKDDYSLGYSTMNGFRASTCTPFFFYDLHKEEITGLKIHPFIFMDSAMIDHLKLVPQDAVHEIGELVGQVEKYGGEAIGIWHNYSLCEKDQYKGWQEVLSITFEKYQNSGS